jgi:hypothetical protein
MHKERAIRIRGVIQSVVGAPEASGPKIDPTASSEAVEALAESVDAVLGARVRGAKVVVAEGTPLVHVRLEYSLSGKRRSMTVFAGTDVLSHAVSRLIETGPFGAFSALIVQGLRESFSEEEGALVTGVRSAADRVLSDPDIVAGVRRSMAEARVKKKNVDRMNFVSQVSSLLSSGWTLDDLTSALDEAVVSNVLHS